MNRILYIEDNPCNIALIEKYLKSYDCKIISEYHATTGVRRALITKPDLIIVDVYLPDESGISVVKQLRQLEGLGNIPIVILTAMDSQRLERQCLEAGADVFLRKPISRIAFIEALSKYLTLVAVT